MAEKQLSQSPRSGRIDDALIRGVREYRKRAHVTQGLMAEFCGVSKSTIKALEYHQPLTEDSRAKIREFLANAPTARTMRPVAKRPPNIYLTQKLLTWARITNQPSDSVEAVRALKAAYDKAKVDEGLASIPLIQLEVENALTLATRGHYRARMQGRE